jgi:HAD superfamily hydrolase (TIGR01509 family)
MTIDIPPGVRAIIFDCDGTLADSMPLHFRAWDLAMRELGGRISEAEFYGLAGVPTARMIEILNERHGTAVPVLEGTEHKEKRYFELMHLLKPIEPVVALARRVKPTMPIAVASGGERYVVDQTLKTIGMEGHFEVIVTASDVKHGKPAPDIFLESARRMGVAAGDCWVLEDGEAGFKAADAAGMRWLDVRPFASA